MAKAAAAGRVKQSGGEREGSDGDGTNGLSQPVMPVPVKLRVASTRKKTFEFDCDMQRCKLELLLPKIEDVGKEWSTGIGGEGTAIEMSMATDTSNSGDSGSGGGGGGGGGGGSNVAVVSCLSSAAHC